MMARQPTVVNDIGNGPRRMLIWWIQHGMRVALVWETAGNDMLAPRVKKKH
jgi:hypothetical protein